MSDAYLAAAIGGEEAIRILSSIDRGEAWKQISELRWVCSTPCTWTAGHGRTDAADFRAHGMGRRWERAVALGEGEAVNLGHTGAQLARD